MNMVRLIHVVPVDDLRTHKFLSTCWCHPTKDGTYPIWVHHAADCREGIEERLVLQDAPTLGWTLVPEYIIPA